jgi:hypothetical protein
LFFRKGLRKLAFDIEFDPCNLDDHHNILNRKIEPFAGIQTRHQRVKLIGRNRDIGGDHVDALFRVGGFEFVKELIVVWLISRENKYICRAALVKALSFRSPARVIIDIRTFAIYTDRSKDFQITARFLPQRYADGFRRSL